MTAVHRASTMTATFPLFLLTGGLPGIAEILPVPDAASPVLNAEAFSRMPALGPELAAQAPFSRQEQGIVPGRAAHFPQGPPGGAIIVCGECSSSLDAAARLAREGKLPEWHSVLALSQHSGRGQLRRAWHSPAGNIYAAMRLPLPGVFSQWNAALAVGWMLAEAFARRGVDIFFKWPNDLILQKGDSWAKIGGILLEERNGILLAGVGINVLHAPDQSLMRPDNAIEAAALADLGYDVSILGLWSHLVAQAQLWYYSKFAKPETSADFRSAEAFLAWKGRQVLVTEAFLHEAGQNPQETISGILLGLSAEGCLRLLTRTDELLLLSGTLRLPG